MSTQMPEDQQWFNYVLDNLDRNWCFKGLSSNQNVTVEIMLDYPDLPWDMYEFSRNDNVHWFHITHPHYANIAWNPKGVSQNDNINWQIVLDNPTYPWDFKEMSKAKFITIEIVLANPTLGWSDLNLCKNPNMTWAIMMANPRWFRNFAEISKNINITIGIVKATPYHKWEFYHLSQNPGIHVSDIQANPQLPWKHGMVFANPSMTLDLILKSMVKISQHGLPYNPNLSFQIIEDYRLEVDYNKLSWNSMSKYKYWDVVRDRAATV